MITSTEISESGLNELAISIYFLGLLYALFGAFVTSCFLLVFFLIWHGLSRFLSYLSELLEVLSFIKNYYFGKTEKNPQKKPNNAFLECGLLENCEKAFGTGDRREFNFLRKDLSVSETEKEKARIERRYKKRRKSRQNSGNKKQDCKNNDILEDMSMKVRVFKKEHGVNSYSNLDLDEINEILDQLMFLKSVKNALTSLKLKQIEIVEIDEELNSEDIIEAKNQKQDSNYFKSQVFDEHTIKRSETDLEQKGENKIDETFKTDTRDLKNESKTLASVESISKILTEDEDEYEDTQEDYDKDEDQNEPSLVKNDSDPDPPPQIEDKKFPDSAVEKHLYPDCKEDVDAIW